MTTGNLATAQVDDVRQSPDVRLLSKVYALGTPFSVVMRIADASAGPAFLGAVPATWAFAAVSGDRRDAQTALSATLAEGTAFLTTSLLKGWVGRPRPYVTHDDIVARSNTHRIPGSADYRSFPSGHAATSFAIAAAVALHSSEWYVVVPLYFWASTVSLSRVWLGVHYPVDVIVGAALGTFSAFVGHVVARELLPAREVTTRGQGISLVRLKF